MLTYEKCPLENNEPVIFIQSVSWKKSSMDIIKHILNQDLIITGIWKGDRAYSRILGQRPESLKKGILGEVLPRNILK